MHDADLGLFFSEMEELGTQLRDTTRLAALRDNVWRQRDRFTFDFHVDRLVAFFREVIAASATPSNGAASSRSTASVRAHRRPA